MVQQILTAFAQLEKCHSCLTTSQCYPSLTLNNGYLDTRISWRLSRAESTVLIPENCRRKGDIENERLHLDAIVNKAFLAAMLHKCPFANAT